MTAPAISNQQADRGQGPATDLPSHLKDGKVSRENSWGVGMLDGRVVWWGQFSLGVSLRVVVSSLLLPPTSVT